MAAFWRYFFGALDDAAFAAVAAFFLESFAACFFSAEILRGLESSVTELSIGLPCEVSGVSAAPGVPGVRVVAAPVGAVACPQALMDISAAIGIMAIQTLRMYTVVTSCIQETCVSRLVCTL
ncbi:MAG TPA: hypothetical protein VGM97_16165 [Steroidobacteraceae bacterium]